MEPNSPADSSFRAAVKKSVLAGPLLGRRARIARAHRPSIESDSSTVPHACRRWLEIPMRHFLVGVIWSVAEVSNEQIGR